jgi:hypothetical protein
MEKCCKGGIIIRRIIEKTEYGALHITGSAFRRLDKSKNNLI